MEWTSPFIVYRLGIDARLEEVFHTDDLKKAKYWLSYIGQPGDVLCRTPIHPKHSGKSKQPEYWSHKHSSGSAMTAEDAWRVYAKERNFNLEFPEEQSKTCDEEGK